MINRSRPVATGNRSHYRPGASYLFTGIILFITASVYADDLARRLRPFTDLLYAEPGTAIEMNISWGEGENERLALDFLLADKENEWFIKVDFSPYQMELRYRDGKAEIYLPKSRTRFVGQGRSDEKHSLMPAGLISRLVSRNSELFSYAGVVMNTDPEFLRTMFALLSEAEYRGDGEWRLHALGDAAVSFSTDDQSRPVMQLAYQGVKVELRIADPERFTGTGGLPQSAEDEDREVTVALAELERMIVRSARRATEVVMPGWILRNPLKQQQHVDNGRLAWVAGQRIVHLWGTPEEIGRAHGLLLAAEAGYCLDSTIHLVGLVETIRSGVWFPQTLRDILERVQPYLPERHLRELDALAAAAGISRDEILMANVFPEFFHCSGFAIYGDATADGALYHGRVLDYMTEIGLHHSNTVFFIEPDDHYNFVNVGYAGFIGSVTGMNEHQISLGEMGGSRRGYWDGVPMSVLMRRALEETATLTEVKQLWQTSPRTCEFFYVFADGKIPSATGVAATWQEIEFIAPGAGHERLGEGIKDTLLLSAGGRLQSLRERVMEGYGNFNAATALDLMSRPVAMRANLHNVLFLPQSLQLYVSHADDQNIAAEKDYVRLDAREWWGSHRK